MVFAYYEGLLTHARIDNDLSVLNEMEEGNDVAIGTQGNRFDLRRFIIQRANV